MIVINDSNRALINKSIPKLGDAYTQVTTFVDELETALVDATITTDLWGSYTISLTRTGYLAVIYFQNDITVSWNDTDSQWEITSIREICASTKELVE